MAESMSNPTIAQERQLWDTGEKQISREPKPARGYENKPRFGTTEEPVDRVRKADPSGAETPSV
jgi:hypothetical protein